MVNGRGIFYGLTGWLISVSLLFGIHIDAAAAGTQSYMDSLNAGVSDILDPGMDDNNKEAIEELTQIVEAADVEVEPTSDLVMANVQMALNVRAEATEESDKVGLLYKDCGGKILERQDGWTKIKSGELVGWASDEYLLFDEDAEEMANEVGNLIVTIETDTLRMRTEPSTDADISVLLAQDDELEVVEVVDDDWISVSYEGEQGYVSAEYVNLNFHIDQGETMEAIRKREAAEAEAKRQAALKANRGAVIVGADDTRLLAALIYCEAGRESYEGKLAVGAVVMNRVRSGAYPNTISGVIYASGQFTPALNGKVNRVYSSNIPESCFQAASEAIGGATNVGDATHFRVAGNHDGLIIDHQVFW